MDVEAVPWLRDSILTTGNKWGRRIADVQISTLPSHLVGQVLLTDEDLEVRLVVYRCDQYSHLGWEEPFSVVLTFPDSSEYEVEVPPSFKLADGHGLRVSLSPGTIVRERQQQADRKIPRVIFNISAPSVKQPSQEVRRLLESVRRITRLLQCTSTYLVVEDDACRREVESSDIPNFLEAYNTLIPGSFKADLVRYYLLYKYGGVYFDDKTLIRESLDSDAFDAVFFNPRGEPVDFFISSHRTPEIAFMGARPGSPIMLRALETAIDKIMRREYTDHRLGITGNMMFTKVLRSGGTEREHGDETSWIRYWGEMCGILPITWSNDGVLAKGRGFLWKRQAIPTADWPRPATHYTSLWTRRLVYADGNPAPSNFRLMLSSQAAAIALQIFIGVGIIALIGFIVSRYPPITWV